jgi:hypothetical protein
VSLWQGRPRRALREVESTLQAHPDDVEARALKAEIERALGRGRLALEGLSGIAGTHVNVDARRDEIANDARPRDDIDASVAHSSDDLRIATLQWAHAVTLAGGRVTVTPRYQLVTYTPAEGRPEGSIRDSRPGLYTRARFNDALELNAQGFIDFVRVHREDRSYRRGTYDTWLTIWPSDVVRMDVSSSRGTLDNVTSLTNGTTLTTAGLSTDVMPSERLRFTGRYHYGWFSDGSRRHALQWEADRRVANHPRLWVGYRGALVRFPQQRGSGYFNPKRFQSHGLQVHGWDAIGPRLFYDAEAGVGLEFQPGDRKPAWNAGAKLTYLASRRVELQARYSYFSSRLASSSGFARGTAGGALLVRW